MSHQRVAARIVSLGLLALVACGDDKAPGVADDEDADVADPDAGRDGGRDGSAEDAGEDAQQPDVDGGNSQCEGDTLEFDVANGVGRPFSSAIVGNRVHVVYVVPSGGGTLASPVAQGLAYVQFGTSGPAEPPSDVVNVGIDSYEKTRDPALVARGSELDLFFTANNADTYELYYKDLDQNAEPMRLTQNMRNEYNSVASAFGNGSAVLFSDEPARLSVAAAVALIPAPGVAPITLVAEARGIHAAQLAFSDIGSDATLRGAVGFVGDLADSGGIFFQKLTATGQTDGELVTLSNEIGGASAIDIARGRTGGAVVYTEAPGGSIHQLRFREIDAQGTVSSVVRQLTSATQDLRDVALTSYAGGYAIAYRRVGGADEAGTTIWLMFVDAQGNVGGSRLVQTASSGGSGIDVLLGNDGRLIVLWVDTVKVTNPTTNREETQLKLHAARLTCVVTNP